MNHIGGNRLVIRLICRCEDKDFVCVGSQVSQGHCSVDVNQILMGLKSLRSVFKGQERPEFLMAS